MPCAYHIIEVYYKQKKKNMQMKMERICGFYQPLDDRINRNLKIPRTESNRLVVKIFMYNKPFK